MKKKTVLNLIIVICIPVLILTSVGLWKAFQYRDVKSADLIYLKGHLSNDPFISISGGKNATRNLVLCFDQFSGYRFLTPSSFFKTIDESYILDSLHFKDSVEIGILESDFHFLSSRNKDWSTVGGFSTSSRLNRIHVYHLKYRDQELLNLNYINSSQKSSNNISTFGSGFFFLLSLCMLIKAIRDKRVLEIN